MYSYMQILNGLKKGIRNNNWRGLNKTEKAFYKASLWYARIHGKILNNNIVSQLTPLFKKLTETRGMLLLRRGYEVASQMLQSYEDAKVFEWAPDLKMWLKDIDYVRWLGISAVTFGNESTA